MDDIRYWLALARTPGLGPVACRQLLKHYSEYPKLLFADAASAAPALAARLPSPLLRALAAPDWSAVESDLAWLEQPGNHALTLNDPRYPPLLKQIHDAPPILYVRGRTEILSAPRWPSSAAAAPAPPDSISPPVSPPHSAAAVLRSPADSPSARRRRPSRRTERWRTHHTPSRHWTGYRLPCRHRGLADEIADSGALGDRIRARHPPLPDRSRAATASSADSAWVPWWSRPQPAAARDHRAVGAGTGREVFAIPGSIHNPRARGCTLIRQGAKLVEGIEDILEELGPLCLTARTLGADTAAPAPPLDDAAAHVLAQIDYAATTLDTLVARTGLGAEQLHHILLDLELANHITSAPGSAYLRRQTEV